MNNIRPKKDIKPIKLNQETSHVDTKLNYAKEILDKTPIFPKPLEYEDIDIAFKKFVEEEILLEVDGIKVPTFTLYSNERFSEFSQMWQHSDSDGNLLMNFKTIIRDKNPKNGTNQGGLWNIPGERKYTLLMRDVLDNNGSESYEIYSMKQPYTVDLLYKVSFITSKFEKINEFNQILNKVFASRQCYIRPNGHFIPMLIEDISDDTEYNLENRKFYIQSCDIKVMAYIIHESDFEVVKKPKQIGLFTESDDFNKLSHVEIEEEEDDRLRRKIELTINFSPFQTKTEFIIDTDMIVENITSNNIRNYRLWINDTPYYTDKGLKLKENDTLKFKIKTFDEFSKSSLILNGINENIVIDNEVKERVSDEIDVFEEIIVE